MAKKFDTNPLDPEFPEKARAQAAAETAQVREGYTSPQHRYETSEFPTAPGSVTEEETRRFEEADFQAYSFRGADPPTVYSGPDAAVLNSTPLRAETKTGLPEKWLIGLPYIPFSIGLVAGLILLFVIPKEENKVRFHAAQGLAAHVGILLVTTILGVVENVTDLASLGSFIFWVVTTVMLVVFAIKAWQGKPVHIESVDDLTNWLEEKIGPLKS